MGWLLRSGEWGMGSGEWKSNVHAPARSTAADARNPLYPFPIPYSRFPASCGFFQNDVGDAFGRVGPGQGARGFGHRQAARGVAGEFAQGRVQLRD